jgi:hypothetical protein
MVRQYYEAENGVDDTALQSTLGELGEEPLNGVEPGAGCRREVEGKTWVAIEPSANVRMLVGGIVVKNDVNDLAGLNFGLMVFRNRMNS